MVASLSLLYLYTLTLFSSPTPSLWRLHHTDYKRVDNGIEYPNFPAYEAFSYIESTQEWVRIQLFKMFFDFGLLPFTPKSGLKPKTHYWGIQVSILTSGKEEEEEEGIQPYIQLTPDVSALAMGYGQYRFNASTYMYNKNHYEDNKVVYDEKHGELYAYLSNERVKRRYTERISPLFKADYRHYLNEDENSKQIRSSTLLFKDSKKNTNLTIKTEFHNADGNRLYSISYYTKVHPEKWTTDFESVLPPIDDLKAYQLVKAMLNSKIPEVEFMEGETAFIIYY